MLIQTEARIVKGEIARVFPNATVELNNVIAIINMKEPVSSASPYSPNIKGSYMLSHSEVFIPNIILNRADISMLPTYMQNEIRKKVRESDARNN